MDVKALLPGTFEMRRNVSQLKGTLVLSTTVSSAELKAAIIGEVYLVPERDMIEGLMWPKSHAINELPVSKAQTPTVLSGISSLTGDFFQCMSLLCGANPDEWLRSDLHFHFHTDEDFGLFRKLHHFMRLCAATPTKINGCCPLRHKAHLS